MLGKITEGCSKEAQDGGQIMDDEMSETMVNMRSTPA
jgi:hypothetical protein